MENNYYKKYLKVLFNSFFISFFYFYFRYIYKIMKNKSIKSIIIKNEYILSSLDKKIIRILIKNIDSIKYKII